MTGTACGLLPIDWLHSFILDGAFSVVWPLINWPISTKNKDKSQVSLRFRMNASLKADFFSSASKHAAFIREQKSALWLSNH
jgi:hypothetical protein